MSTFSFWPTGPRAYVRIHRSRGSSEQTSFAACFWISLYRRPAFATLEAFSSLFVVSRIVYCVDTSCGIWNCHINSLRISTFVVISSRFLGFAVSSWVNYLTTPSFPRSGGWDFRSASSSWTAKFKFGTHNTFSIFYPHFNTEKVSVSQ